MGGLVPEAVAGLSSPPEDETQAAIKIQAVARGRADRRKVAAMKEEHRAATRIQAVARGRADRRRVAAMSTMSTTGPSTVSAEQERAAVRIQAAARGRADRRRVAALRAGAMSGADVAAVAPDLPLPPGAVLGDHDDSARVAAAIRIQAVARGRRDRRRVAGLRGGGGGAEPPAPPAPSPTCHVVLSDGSPGGLSLPVQREGVPLTATVGEIVEAAWEGGGGEYDASVRPKVTVGATDGGGPSGLVWDDSLKACGARAGGTIELVVGGGADAGSPPDKASDRHSPVSHVEGVVEVEVPPEIDPETGEETCPGRVVRVAVTVDTSGHAGPTGRKKFLGGYRHKETRLEYHNATAQTTRVPKYTEADRKLSREAQTVSVRTRKAQTTREGSTQVARPDFYVGDECDVVVMASSARYQTSEELLVVWEAAARTMQRWWRGSAGRARAAELRAERDAERDRKRAEEEAAAEAAELHRQREIRRRVQPLTSADFALLRDELEAWRLAQTDAIAVATGTVPFGDGGGLGDTAATGGHYDSAGPGASRGPGAADPEALASRHAQLERLLGRETRLLQTIDRLEQVAGGVRRERRIDRQLADLAAAKTWQLSDGGTVDVHTPFTVRARELAHLYHGLVAPDPALDARLDILLHVKYTAREFDCALTRELCQLVDREADLLNRGRPTSSLAGLRRRIANLFLAFVETPEFNPEAARYSLRAAGARGVVGKVTVVGGPGAG